jgi:hypothetical protein
VRHFELAIFRNNDHGLQLPLYGHPSTLPDGTAVFVPGEIELRDERRKELAMETGQSQPWHMKPVAEMPDWLDVTKPRAAAPRNLMEES